MDAELFQARRDGGRWSEDDVGQLPAAFRTLRRCSNPALWVVPSLPYRAYLKVLTGQHLRHLVVSTAMDGYVNDQPVLRTLVKADRKWPCEGAGVPLLVVDLVRLNHLALPTFST
jgi:hypothetical protein